MHQGSRWRVGAGVRITVLNQPWIPDASNPYVTSDRTALQGVCVNDLMQIGKREWDVDIIEDLFNSRDKSLIYSIPLGDYVSKDDWYWWWEKEGSFTVKSAYKYLQSSNGRWRGVNNSGF